MHSKGAPGNRRQCNPVSAGLCDGIGTSFRLNITTSDTTKARFKSCINITKHSQATCTDVNTGTTRSGSLHDGLWNPVGGMAAEGETNANVEGSYCNMPLTAYEEGMAGLPIIGDLPAWKSV